MSVAILLRPALRGLAPPSNFFRRLWTAVSPNSKICLVFDLPGKRPLTRYLHCFCINIRIPRPISTPISCAPRWRMRLTSTQQRSGSGIMTLSHPAMSGNRRPSDAPLAIAGVISSDTQLDGPVLRGRP